MGEVPSGHPPHDRPRIILRLTIGLIVVSVWAFDNVMSMFFAQCGVDWWTHLLLFAVVAALFPEGVAGVIEVLRGAASSVNGRGKHG